MIHSARIAELTTSYTEAMARLQKRLDAATAEQLEKMPEGGGWSAAQIAWHVGATNDAFAGLIDGGIPIAKPPIEGFTETPWSAIASQVPEKLEAPKHLHPPAHVTRDEALAKVETSRQRLIDALTNLDEHRARMTVKSSVGTRITLYQVGIWAAAHTARHNAQIKRLVGF